MAHKGHAARHWARLSPEQVLAIRDAYAAGGITMKALGARYGVHAVTVFDVVHRRTHRRPA